jgi:acyl-CoA thioester hydrolase
MDGAAQTEVTVRFAETDAQGIAHNAAYLVWFEVARIDYLARHAQGYKHIQQEGFEALTTESHVRYVRPAFFDDRLIVNARVVGVRARFTQYVITRTRGRRRRLDEPRSSTATLRPTLSRLAG